MNLIDVKNKAEEQLKEFSNDMLLPDANITISENSAKILKMSLLEARRLQNEEADSEHLLLALLRTIPIWQQLYSKIVCKLQKCMSYYLLNKI